MFFPRDVLDGSWYFHTDWKLDVWKIGYTVTPEKTLLALRSGIYWWYKFLTTHWSVRTCWCFWTSTYSTSHPMLHGLKRLGGLLSGSGYLKQFVRDEMPMCFLAQSTGAVWSVDSDLAFLRCFLLWGCGAHIGLNIKLYFPTHSKGHRYWN